MNNIMKAFNRGTDELVTLGRNVTLTALMGLGGLGVFNNDAQAQEIKIDKNAKVDTTNVQRVTRNGVEGVLVKGKFYSDPVVEVSEDGITKTTTFTRGEFSDFNGKNAEKNSLETPIDPMSVKTPESTDEQKMRYALRWMELQKKNNWTDEEVRQKQREEDLAARERIARRNANNNTSYATKKVDERLLAIEKVIIEEREGKTKTLLQYVTTANVAKLPVLNKAAWVVAAGGIHQENPKENTVSWDPNGVFVKGMSPTFGLFSVSAEAARFAGYPKPVILPEYALDNDELYRQEYDAFTTGDDRYEFRAQAELGYTFSSKVKQYLDPNIYDLSQVKKSKELSAVNVRAYILGGAEHVTPLDYNAKKSEFDVVDPVIQTETLEAEKNISNRLIYGAGLRATINLGKIKSYVETANGQRITTDEFEQQRLEFLEQQKQNKVTVTLESGDTVETSPALGLAQMKAEKSLIEFNENYKRLVQKRSGFTIYFGAEYIKNNANGVNYSEINQQGSNYIPKKMQASIGLAYSF